MAIILPEHRHSMEDQHRFIPRNEIPTNGPILDIRHALDANAGRISTLDAKIRNKRINTAKWVEKTYPGMTAVQLTRPYVWAEADPQVQEQASKWIIDTIYGVYGEGYPLANKKHSVNMQGFKERSLLTYYGIIAPEEISNGHINEEPQLALHPDIKAIATSSLVRSPHGIAELGRTARLTEFPQFDGGVLALESGLDWYKNRFRLNEQIHHLIATVRGGAEHFHTPSSGPIQNLLLGQVGMSITEIAPYYNVNNMEPVLEADLPRTVEERQAANRDQTIFTPTGEHVEALTAFVEHQMGKVAPKIRTLDHSGHGYTQATATYNGENIYGGIDTKPIPNGDQQIGLQEAINYLEDQSPIVRVKVPVTPQGAATQALLMRQGYTFTGFHAAANTEYLDLSGDEPTIEIYKTEPYVVFAKFGRMTRNGLVDVVPAYLPTPNESGGRDLHRGHGSDGDKMRELLYRIDAGLRSTIGR